MKLTYAEQLKHPNWQRRRLERLESANWQCLACGAKTRELHVHHRKYIKDALPWEYVDALLAVLCGTCHALQHADQELLLDLLLCAQPRAFSHGLAAGLIAQHLSAQGDLPVDLAERVRSRWGRRFAVTGSVAALSTVKEARPQIPDGVAALLNRALALAVASNEDWLRIGPETQTFLMATDAPFGGFFFVIHDVVRDDGPISRSAMLDVLKRHDLSGTDLLAALEQVNDNVDRTEEIELLVRKLRLHQVDEELKQIFQSERSAASDARARELMELRKQLKS